MSEQSPAAKARIKADERSGSWWMCVCVAVIFGAWILSKLDLLDMKPHGDLIALPGIVAVLYWFKGAVRKLIQEELSDETID